MFCRAYHMSITILKDLYVTTLATKVIPAKAGIQ
jgi:hypothetical protein